MTRSAWITGVGAATPLGNGFDEFADRLLAGWSGVAERKVVESGFAPRQMAAAVAEIPLPPAWPPDDFASRNRLEQMALSCSARALADAGFDDRRGLRIGLVLGMGAERLRTWELDLLAGGRRVYEPQSDGPSLVHVLSADLGLSGPAVSVAAACASSGFALALARRWIRLGWVDACLAGGCDLITPMSYVAFYNLRALSRSEGPPAAASRPFDRGRDGFIMGEGGAVFLLEADDVARRRGAVPYAELAGFGTTSDAAHMVIPSDDPQPASEAIRAALDDACLEVGAIDYVNAHATSTPVGDRAETRALQLALGEATRRTPVSSTKSMTGHLLSGAAAVEALACLVALRRQALPPTINLDDPDPECALCHVAREAQSRRVEATISNSFGFGGSNTCVALRRVA